MRCPKLYKVIGNDQHGGWFTYFFVTYSEARAKKMAIARWKETYNREFKLNIHKPKIIEWITGIDEEFTGRKTEQSN